MKLVIASLLFAATSSFAIASPVSSPAGLVGSESFLSSATSFFQLPEAKGRTGSSRVGGSNSHGKGSKAAKARSPKSPSDKSVGGIKRDAKGKIHRSSAAKGEFKKSKPCPSTGKSSGTCPGYVIDHVKPLKRGGEDAPSNMQWQTKRDAKEKDKTE